MLTRLLNVVFYFLSGFVPRDESKILFGAWMGHKFADNPKYLLLYLSRESTRLDLVWCGHSDVRRQIPPDVRVRFVRHGSLAAVKEVLTSGSCVVTHGFRDVSTFNLLRGATLAYLGHGVAIKRMGSVDRALKSRLVTYVRQVLRKADSFSYYVAASREHKRKLLQEYAVNNITADRVLEIGQPRVDFLIESVRTGRSLEIRTQFCEHHHLPKCEKLIAYMPTFRDKGCALFSFAALSGEQRNGLEEFLERTGSILVEKSHFRDRQYGAMASAEKPRRVVQLDERSTPVETQELLLATDLLITDYSGCYLDYLLLDRPVIHFAYDRQDYASQDRGLYFEYATVVAGPIVVSFSQLLRHIDAELKNPDREHERRQRVRRTLLEFERGESSARLAEVIGART